MIFLVVFTPLGPMLAPAFGGCMASYFGWRSSFLCLACVLMLLLCLGISCLKESCPDTKIERKVSDDALTILQDRHLMTLVISAMMLGSTIQVIVTNVPYVIEEEHGKTILVTSFFLTGLATSAILGMAIVPTFMPASILQSSNIALALALTCASLTAVVAFSLAQHFSSIFCFFLQTGTLLPPCVYLSTMASTPVANYAALMGAIGGCISSAGCALFSMLGTRITAFYGGKGLMLTVFGLIVSACMIFWAGFGHNPPTWALEADEHAPEADKKDQTPAKAGC